MDEVPVTTTRGALLGSRHGPVSSFRGIPYAAPPVGERRWRPPAPAEPWEGRRPALDIGPAPLQPQPPRSSVMWQYELRGPAGTGDERGLPLPQRLDARPDPGGGPAGHGLPPGRRQPHRARRGGDPRRGGRRVARCRRRHPQHASGCARLPRASRAGRREPRGRVGQLRAARCRLRARVGRHGDRRVRRGPGGRDARRQLGGRGDPHAPHGRPGEPGAVPLGDRAELVGDLPGRGRDADAGTMRRPRDFARSAGSAPSRWPSCGGSPRSRSSSTRTSASWSTGAW